jgi:hypothetical protein
MPGKYIQTGRIFIDNSTVRRIILASESVVKYTTL